MYAEERQRSIAEQVRRDRRVSVSAAAELFGVTTETVRRDLALLEQEGLVRRVHGGAVPADALTTVERAVTERHARSAHEKDQVARAALGLLPSDGGSFLLDSGTTTGRLARVLPSSLRATVVTNSPYIAANLADRPTLDVELLGGRVRHSSQAAVGPSTLRALGDIRVDVSFVGTNGLTVDHGLSTPDPDEAAVKRAMVAAGRRVVVVADSSKLGEQTLHRFAELSSIDALVTDAGVPDDLVDELEAREIEVVRA